MNVIYVCMPIDPIVHLCVLRSITHKSWTIITKSLRKETKGLGHTNAKCHNMIASLTTSDLRNTLCGRLKLQKKPKNENYIVTDTVWPIIGIDLLFLRFFPYLSWVFSASKRNPCYFCDFCDIWGHFGALLGFFFSKFRILLNLLFLRFLRYLSQVFLARKKNPCYFCDFCDIGGHFGALLGFFAF